MSEGFLPSPGGWKLVQKAKKKTPPRSKEEQLQNNLAAGSQGVVTTPPASCLRPQEPPHAGAGHHGDRGELSPCPRVPKPRAEPGRQGLLPRSVSSIPPDLPALNISAAAFYSSAFQPHSVHSGRCRRSLKTPQVLGKLKPPGTLGKAQVRPPCSCLFCLEIQPPQPSWLSSTSASPACGPVTLVLSSSLLPPVLVAAGPRPTNRRQRQGCSCSPAPVPSFSWDLLRGKK